MSESKPTPGPWQAFGQRVIATEMPRIEYGERQQYSRGYCVTQTHLYTDPNRDTAEANARLIAAAPETTEALEEALRWIGSLTDWAGAGDPDVEKWRAALAKAKGEKS